MKELLMKLICSLRSFWLLLNFGVKKSMKCFMYSESCFMRDFNIFMHASERICFWVFSFWEFIKISVDRMKINFILYLNILINYLN